MFPKHPSTFQENLYSKRFEQKLAELHEVHPDFTCRHGYTDSYGKRRLKRYSVVEDAMDAMRQYCQEHNINIVELFSRFDADGSMSVTHEEFKLGLKVRTCSPLVVRVGRDRGYCHLVFVFSFFSSFNFHCIPYQQSPTTSVFCYCSPFSYQSLQVSLTAFLPLHSRSSSPLLSLHFLGICSPCQFLISYPFHMPDPFQPFQIMLLG